MPAIPKLPPTEAELEEEAERQKELIAQAWAEYEVEKDKRLSCLIQIDVELAYSIPYNFLLTLKAVKSTPT